MMKYDDDGPPWEAWLDEASQAEFLEQEMSYADSDHEPDHEPSDYVPTAPIAPIPPVWHAENERCNGICLAGYEVGVPGHGGIAYAHPECALHSDAGYYDYLMDQYDNEMEMSYADAMAESEEVATDEGGWGAWMGGEI